MTKRRLKKATWKAMRTLRVTRREKAALLAEPLRAATLAMPDHPQWVGLFILLRKYVVDLPPGTYPSRRNRAPAA